MPTETVYLQIEPKAVREKVLIERPIRWFDSESKHMWTFYGGRLEFEFNRELKQLVPKVEWDEEKKRWRTKNETFETKTIFRSNRKEIEEWIKQFKTVFGLEKNEEDTDTRVVAVDVDRVHVRNMEIALDRHQIRYEIDG